MGPRLLAIICEAGPSLVIGPPVEAGFDCALIQEPIFSLNRRADLPRSGLYPGWVLVRIAISVWFAPFPSLACLEDGAYRADLAARGTFRQLRLVSRVGLPIPALPTLLSQREECVSEKSIFGEFGGGAVGKVVAW